MEIDTKKLLNSSRDFNWDLLRFLFAFIGSGSNSSACPGSGSGDGVGIISCIGNIHVLKLLRTFSLVPRNNLC